MYKYQYLEFSMIRQSDTLAANMRIVWQFDVTFETEKLSKNAVAWLTRGKAAIIMHEEDNQVVRQAV